MLVGLIQWLLIGKVLISSTIVVRRSSSNYVGPVYGTGRFFRFHSSNLRS